MATESVTQTTEQSEIEHGPAAFAGYDASVFSGWAAAVADLLACGAARGVDPQTIPDAGSLMYSLVQAARELTQTELTERRAQA